MIHTSNINQSPLYVLKNISTFVRKMERIPLYILYRTASNHFMSVFSMKIKLKSILCSRIVRVETQSHTYLYVHAGETRKLYPHFLSDIYNQTITFHSIRSKRSNGLYRFMWPNCYLRRYIISKRVTHRILWGSNRMLKLVRNSSE